MALDPTALGADARAFVSERHLATLTTQRSDGSPHVVAVGFTWDDEARIARVICMRGGQKAVNARRGGRAVVAQVDGPRWLAFEGPVSLAQDASAVADAVERYAGRYGRTPEPNPDRVVVCIAVDRVLGRA